MTSRVFKLFQRKLYDILSNKCYVFILLIVFGCFISSLFLFGEAVVDWANHKYVHYIRLFEDNLAQTHLEKELCAELPIDIVYTWVNGSDPKLLHQLQLLQGKNYLRFSTCRYMNCISLQRVIVIPALSAGQKSAFVDRFNLSGRVNLLYDVLHHQSPNTMSPNNATVVHVLKRSPFLNISTTVIEDTVFSIYPLYVTSESIAEGFVSPVDSYIMDKQPDKSALSKASLVEAYLRRSDINTLNITESDSAVLATFSSESLKLRLDNKLNGNSSGSSFSAKPAYLVWDFNMDDSLSGDFAASRFQDNEELKYSLRSVERYAPWVHHIFLVTNGQLPVWLDLTNPRLTVVQHADIFPNKSHLPTFSSPAIESHLHRIPGLSRFFLYFNDDVFLGKKVTPSDFYTQSGGYKVYLSWSVPNCREDCPSNWLKDGYCDKACNYSECAWDEGDCLHTGGQVGYPLPASGNLIFGGSLRGGGLPIHNQAFMPAPMCSRGCGDNWLGDRYCDMACNNPYCGFDVGDCGDTDLDKIFSVRVLFNHSIYHIPPGVPVAIIDLRPIFGMQGEILRGEFPEQPRIRLISLAQKYKKLFILLKNITSVEQNTTRETSPFDLRVDLYGKTFNENYINMSLSVIFNSLLPNEVIEEPRIASTEAQPPVPPAFTGYHNVSKHPYPVFENSSLSDDVKSIRFGVAARSPTLRDRHLTGFLPWEKQDIRIKSATNLPGPVYGRRLLASYADSLKYTNRRLSHVYGHSQRKVPGHMPHFIDRHIMLEVQDKFKEDWDETSSHQVRSPEDIQFALAYYYYLMSEMKNRTVMEVLSDLDNNNDSILDNKELMVMALRMFDSPISESDRVYFNKLIANCSLNDTELETDNGIIKTRISKRLLSECEDYNKEFKKRYHPVSKFKFETLGEDELWFKMISANVSRVKHHLDEIIRSPRKFLCINDNLNHFDNESKAVKRLLGEFLRTLYPTPSQFELPIGLFNSHLHFDDYITEARMKKLQILVIGLSIITVLTLVCCFFSSRFCRRFCFWRGRYKRRIMKIFDA